MTKMIAVNDQNDLYIGPDGNLALVFDIEAVKQACEHAVKAILNEMIYNSNNGVPYFETIWRLGGSPNLSQYEAAVRATILAVDGVTGIQELDISINNNQLSYSATINTIYGQVLSNVL